MDKRIISLVWILVAATGVVAVRFPLASASSLIEVSVSPQYVAVDVGQSFSVNITIANVPSPGVYSYQFSLYYDSAVLQCVSAQIPPDHFMKPVNPSNIFIVDPGTINQTQGRVTFALTLLGNEAGKTGGGVLATVRFTALAVGISLLELKESDCILVDSDQNEVPSSQYQLGSGSVSVGSVGMQVFLSPRNNSVLVGQSFSVSIDIANVPSPGLFSYQLRLYYDTAVLQCADVQIPSGYFLKPIDPNDISIVDPGTINQSAGYVAFALTLLGNEPGKAGSGVLATVRFTALAVGISLLTSLLELRDVCLVDSNATRFSADQYGLWQGSVKVVPISVMQQISIADYSVSLGAKNVTVEVIVENASTIVGGSFDIYFNKLVVNSVSLSSGDFGEPVYVVDNNGPTYVMVKVAVSGATTVGKDVATLAKVTFHGINGSTILGLQNALLNDEKGNTFAPLSKDGSIIVQYPQIVMSSGSVEVGSTVNVSIVVLNAEDLAGFSMNMTFNSSIINVVHVFPGDFGVPTTTIRNNESTVSLASALASAVGKPNATLAVLSCTGMSQGTTFFRVQNVEFNDEEGNLVIPVVVGDGGFFPPGWTHAGEIGPLVAIPEFQPTAILLIFLLLGSIAVMMKRKLLKNRSAVLKTQKQRR